LDTLTIFHNPNCSTSRKVLAILRDRGLQPTVVEYLKTGWTRQRLDTLLQAMQAGPRAILRSREALVKELGLDRAEITDEQLITAMIAHPVLVERPIVVGLKGAAVCRPVERVEALL
jgi:arsenate reductase